LQFSTSNRLIFLKNIFICAVFFLNKSYWAVLFNPVQDGDATYEINFPDLPEGTTQ